jgi:glucose-1-phosphate thymidylyltransferase
MAGMGKRMRPHTLVTPKPLITFAGKPMVHHIVEELVKTCQEPVEEIAFITGDFGKEVESNLIDVAAQVGARGTIYHQQEPLGTAHAVLCAAPSLEGKLIVAFADTLFKADFQLDEGMDSVIWVQKVEDPKPFGVVKINQEGLITDFVEKPQVFVSDLAIIGIYYFRDGKNLRAELQHLIDNDIREKGEYQITNALENMQRKGLRFAPGQVNEWLDCGNRQATVETHRRWLKHFSDGDLQLDASIKQEDSTIIQPCIIGKNVEIRGSVIGPFVSIAENTRVENSVIKNSIIQKNSHIQNAVIMNSMVGSNVSVQLQALDLSLGDYSTIQGS